jgi:hypothetical protein
MRFDVTCNIALRTASGQDLQVCSLPAHTGQQRLLHEVIWVEGCERWTVSPRPGGERVLDVSGCQQEIRIAFAASLSVAPVWCRSSALRTQPEPPIRLASGYSQPGEHWSAQRIIAALGPGLRTTATAFAALPELFEWLQGADASELLRCPRSPANSTDPTSDFAASVPETLRLAVPVFRALGVPARIAVGFAPERQPVHPRDARCAYLELYGSGRWWLFEPNGQVPACGFVRTAVGSDPADLALVRGTAPATTVKMDASVDPPPSWGLPSKISNPLLLSLEPEETLEAGAAPDAEAGGPQPVVGATTPVLAVASA